MTSHKPRVAIVRGPYLNPFEMQTYALLQSQFDLTCIAANSNMFQTDLIPMPVIRLHQPREVGFNIPKWRGFCNMITRRLFGSEDRLLGLHRVLAEFDIIHAAETFNYFSLQAVQAKQQYGSKVVLTVWQNLPFYQEDISHIAAIKKQVREGTNLFLAVTEQAKVALCLEGVPAGKIKVMGAGIDTNVFNSQPSDQTLYQQYGLDGNERIILYIGSLLRSKGVHDLLFAAKYMQDKGYLNRQPVRFLLFGKGPEEAWLRQRIKEFNLSTKVKLMGSVSYQQIPEIHRLADIFVLPSIPTPEWQEQFGMVLAESMATGKAVVTTCSGAIPEVVEEAAILVPPATPVALGQAIYDLLLNTAERNRLGVLGRQRIETQYSCQIVSHKIAQAYAELISRK